MIKDPEVVELSRAVNWSLYKDVPMLVFRTNGAEPTMSCVTFMVLLSLVAAYADILGRNVVGQKEMNQGVCTNMHER